MTRKETAAKTWVACSMDDWPLWLVASSITPLRTRYPARHGGLPSPPSDRLSSLADAWRLDSNSCHTDGQVSAARWLTAALLVAPPTPVAAQAKPDWAAFDRYVAKAAADWRIPALAIAVIKDDSVVFAKGYGVLRKGSSEPANEHTRFAIGSTTKAMTSASIAMLVDDGKLKLDDPVTKYIPE